jgi:hypothetical protein
MNDSLIDRTIKELSVLLELLVPRLVPSEKFVEFVLELGWDFPQEKVPDFGELVNDHIPSLTNSIIKLDQSSTDGERIANLFALIDDLLVTVEDIKNISAKFSTSGTWPGTIDINEFVSKFPEQLLHYLIIEYLERHHRGIYALCRMIDAIHVEFIPESGRRLAYTARTFDLSKLEDFITDPKAAANTLYKWGGDQFESQRFLDVLEDICIILGIPAGQYLPQPTIASRLLEIPDPTYAQMGKELRIPIYEVPDSGIGYVEAGINVYPIPDKEEPPGNSLQPGIALIPFINGSAGETIPLGGGFELTISGDLSAGIAIELRPGKTTGKANLLDSQATSLNGELKAIISRPNKNEPIRIFEGPGDSYLAIQDMSHSIGVIVTSQNETDVYWELNLNGGEIVVSAGEGDGFLQKILPSKEIRAGFDITAGWSSEGGIYFRGSGALEITIPIHETLGPLTLESIYVTIKFGANISTVLAVSAGAKIGPVVASVERIGVEIPIVLKPDNDGNLGLLQINKPQFKPPLGAGLAIDAGGIVGSGFLKFDDPNKRYAGILALNFGEIGLTAIGLITTRMPDGSDGFSLLVNIGVTFDPPIQLSFGFTLSGVGGLIGINRTIEIEVLQRGIRNRTLDSILFPDPDTVIANASKIISDLRAVFPPSEGRFVVGPMVKFGWGPNIITAEIGIFLELPDPIRIVLMGQLAATLPEEENGLVVIHLDILGVLDFAKEELTFQASLYDSRVMKFTIFGDSAFLLGWGNDPRFGLSLGGFHPKFTPPPPIIFGDLKRLTICISSGKSLQLSCRAYMALTPNSLQFGARVDLYASGGGAELTGMLSLDTLIFFSPFAFEVWINAGVGIKYKGVSLLDVELSFLLAGPTPWLARGKAKIKILFVSIKVGFKITWGEKEKATLPAVDPWVPFQKALTSAGNWGSVLPDGRTLVESMRGREEGTPEQIVIHPAGRIEVRQNVVPMGVGLSKTGNAPITGHDLFDIVEMKTNGDTLELGAIEEFFARGQYEELSSQQRLSVPSFEKMKGGVTNAASEAVRVEGAVEDTPLEYESILIRPDRTSQRQKPKGTLEWEYGEFVAKAGIRRKAIGRAGPRKRFGALRVKPKVGVSEELYCIAIAENLKRAEGDQTKNISPEVLESLQLKSSQNLTRMVADQLLQAQRELDPRKAELLIVIPEYEVFEEAA